MTAHNGSTLDREDAEAVAVVTQHLMDGLAALTETWQRSFDAANRPAASSTPLA
jgi:hypothetical protein